MSQKDNSGEFLKALELNDIAWPEQLKAIAIGQATAKALRAFHIDTHGTPDVPDSEHLLELPYLQQVSKKNLLLFKGEGGRQLLEKELVQRGARVTRPPEMRRRALR